MSLSNQTTVTCPGCNSTFQTTIWSSVNTDLSKDLAEKIISGEFFDARCPKCGTTFTLEYNVLYHDIKRGVMIWLIGKETPNYWDKCAEVRSAAIQPGYKTRLVKDVDELREKVAALEAGRDDRVIELCKFFIKHNAPQQHPEFRPRRVFYTYAGEKEVVFLYDADGNQMSCYLDAQLYDMIAEDFSDQLSDCQNEQPYAVYDSLWAERVFLRHNSKNDRENAELASAEKVVPPDSAGVSDSVSGEDGREEGPPLYAYFDSNPFYILDVLCTDERKKIISAAEEKSFLLDAEICAEAQNTLLTPNKRLAAEMDWFIEAEGRSLQAIKKQIEAGEEIDAEEYEMLSKLNALLYNFSISKETDPSALGLEILDINRCFAELDLAELTEAINRCRKKAKMAEVTEADVSAELGKKRERIRVMISGKLQSLREMDYIAMVTVFAETYIADEEFDDSGIISDVIDQYEIWSKAAMDAKEELIQDCIKSIKNSSEHEKREQMVEALIKRIREWDKYAQPLQVCISARGMEDRISRNLAADIRDLAVYLHNEKGETGLALRITESLKKYFAELSEVLEVVKDDAQTLQRLQAEKETFEREKESHRRADKAYTVDIQGDQINIPPYCTCCMAPTENKERVSAVVPEVFTAGIKTLGVDMPVCGNCLKHREAPERQLLLVCGLAILAGSLAMLLLTLAECPGFVGFVISSIIAVGGYFVFGHVIKLGELPSRPFEHSARGKSVRLFSKRNYYPGIQHSAATVTFAFTNWEYAHLFKEANGDRAGEVKEIYEPNTAKRVSVLSVAEKENQSRLATAAIAVFIMLSLLIANSNFSDGDSFSAGGSSNSNSSYTNHSETYKVTLDKQNGIGGSNSIIATDGEPLPYATAPTRSGYEFDGYYSKPNGVGIKYYDSNMRRVADWYGNSDETIYAYWIKQFEINRHNGVRVTKENFEDYFTLSTEAELIGDDDIKIIYSIKPKSNLYASNPDSSDTISVEIGASVSAFSFYHGEPTYDEKYTVTLNKSQNYTASGSFSFKHHVITETVYWIADVTYCSGSIGE